MDINDPANPFGRVRRVEIKTVIHYVGEDAWNQNILVPKLETYLRQHGYDLRQFRAVKYWDKDENEIDEQEFKDYVYARHGHTQGKCSSCPDPVKWKEAERLHRRIRAERGGLTKNKKHKTKVVYILETEEERALRKKIEENKVEINSVDLVKGGGNRVEEL